jgi:hypothetical protein
MMHLLRDYEDKKAVGECGAKNLKDSEATMRFCDVDCPQCQKTRAFKKGMNHPFYGVPQEKRSRKPRRIEVEEVPDEDGPTWEEIEKSHLG